MTVLSSIFTVHSDSGVIGQGVGCPGQRSVRLRLNRPLIASMLRVIDIDVQPWYMRPPTANFTIPFSMITSE
jgi:hypothetical protein